MKEKWEENKVYILSVIAGLVVVLFGWRTASSIADEAAGKIERARVDINNAVDEIDNREFLLSESQATQEANLLNKQQLQSNRLAELIFPPPDKPLPPDNPAHRLESMTDAARRRIEGRAGMRGVRISAKKWGIESLIKAKKSHEELADLHVRLLATERLLSFAVNEAHVREVQNVQQLPDERMPVPYSEGEKDILLLPVRITCIGTAETLTRFVYEATRKSDNSGRFFYLREAEISSGRRKAGGSSGDSPDTRRGVFVLCPVLIVKSENPFEGARKTKRPLRRGRRRRR